MTYDDITGRVICVREIREMCPRVVWVVHTWDRCRLWRHRIPRSVLIWWDHCHRHLKDTYTFQI